MISQSWFSTNWMALFWIFVTAVILVFYWVVLDTGTYESAARPEESTEEVFSLHPNERGTDPEQES